MRLRLPRLTLQGSFRQNGIISASTEEEAIPYSIYSPWNTPIPEAAATATNSAAIVSKLTGWGEPQAIQAGVMGTAQDFHVPRYDAKDSDPLVTINTSNTNDRRHLQLRGKQIRLPAAAVAAGGSDAHLLCAQPNKRELYEFFGVTSITGGVLSCQYAGRTRARGDGFDNSGAYASKTGAYAGRITTLEWIKAAAGLIQDFGHAIGFMGRSTDNTFVWPADGLAGNGDPTNAPPCGSLFQGLWTPSEINALNRPNVAKVILRTICKYGMYYIDTTGNNGSWIFRSVGNDTADQATGRGTPMLNHAIAQGNAGDWWLDTGVWYFRGLIGLDWAGKLRVVDPAAMKTVYDATLTGRRIQPVATVANAWTLTGAASAHAALTEAVMAPALPTAALRIGSNVPGNKSEVRLATPTLPTIEGIGAWGFYNAGANSFPIIRLKSGVTVLAQEARTLLNTNYGWYSVYYDGDMSAVDLADLRIEFEEDSVDDLAAQQFVNAYEAYGMVE